MIQISKMVPDVQEMAITRGDKNITEASGSYSKSKRADMGYFDTKKGF